MSIELTVDPSFEGPPACAHGGYVCGRLAGYLPTLPTLPVGVEVTLRSPVPLGVALGLQPRVGGVAAYDGETLVAEAEKRQLAGPAPAPPSYAEALAASAAFAGLAEHPYPHCVVCGTERVDAGAFRIFPGRLAARDLLAAVWLPTAAAVEDGRLRPEFAWAAMDCPAGWAASFADPPGSGPFVLGRMAARLSQPIAAGEAYLLVGWCDRAAGRKRFAGSALYARDGALLGLSRQIWLEVARPEPAR